MMLTDGRVSLVENQVDLAVRIGELPAIDAAIAGIGVTRLLSYQIANAVQSGTLVLALGEFEPTPVPVSLVHAGGRLLPLKVRAFLDFAEPRLKVGLMQGAL